MKKYLLLLVTCILLLSSCDEDCTEPCLSPDSVGVIDAEVMDAPDGTLLSLITFEWDEVASANTYSLRVFKNGVLFLEGGTDTNFYTADVGTLAIDDEIAIEVLSNCNCGSSGYSERSVFRYKNGGATVDIVPFNARRGDICNITCEYVSFPARYHVDCENNSLFLRYKNTGFIFFRTADVCDCLNTFNNDCDGIQNLRECLDNLSSYIKDGYGTTCP